MKRKNGIINCFVILIALLLFFIWHQKSNNEAVTTLNNRLNFQIYLITMDKTDEHWYHIDDGASDMAELMGVSYQWEAPEKKDTQQQIDIINSAVERGADAIMIAANDPIRLSSAIEDAKAKAVKIIYVDSPANEEAITTLATDNYLAGSSAANAMISELEEEDIKQGSIGIIGVNTATDSTMRREGGFRETMEADGRFTLLETVYNNGDPIASEASAADLIQKNDNLVGLFGTNEGSTEGVGNAIKKSNRNITGVGFDQSRAILNLIRDGSLKTVMVQNPYTMGYLGMAEAVAALKGYDTGSQYYNTGVSVKTRTRKD